MGPTVGATLFVVSNIATFQCVFYYLILSYPKYAASVLAGSDFVRSTVRPPLPSSLSTFDLGPLELTFLSLFSSCSSPPASCTARRPSFARRRASTAASRSSPGSPQSASWGSGRSICTAPSCAPGAASPAGREQKRAGWDTSQKRRAGWTSRFEEKRRRRREGGRARALIELQPRPEYLHKNMLRRRLRQREPEERTLRPGSTAGPRLASGSTARPTPAGARVSCELTARRERGTHDELELVQKARAAAGTEKSVS